MALRTFTDKAGVEWQVWDVRPEARYQGMTNHDLEGGWLVFQSEFDKRRLCPIPAEWKGYSAEQLDHLSQAARSAHSVAA
jgi:hypothetical protein